MEEEKLDYPEILFCDYLVLFLLNPNNETELLEKLKLLLKKNGFVSEIHHEAKYNVALDSKILEDIRILEFNARILEFNARILEFNARILEFNDRSLEENDRFLEEYNSFFKEYDSFLKEYNRSFEHNYNAYVELLRAYKEFVSLFWRPSILENTLKKLNWKPSLFENDLKKLKEWVDYFKTILIGIPEDFNYMLTFYPKNNANIIKMTLDFFNELEKIIEKRLEVYKPIINNHSPERSNIKKRSSPPKPEKNATAIKEKTKITKLNFREEEREEDEGNLGNCLII